MSSKQMCLTDVSALLDACMALQSDVLPAPGRPHVKAKQTLALSAWYISGAGIMHSLRALSVLTASSRQSRRRLTAFGLSVEWAGSGQPRNQLGVGMYSSCFRVAAAATSHDELLR